MGGGGGGGGGGGEGSCLAAIGHLQREGLFFVIISERIDSCWVQ